MSYPSGHSAQFGNVLTPTQVKDKPRVTWEANEDALYTLVMLDPDMSARLLGRQYFEMRHWIVINIPGNSVEKGIPINILNVIVQVIKLIVCLFWEKGKKLSNILVPHH